MTDDIQRGQLELCEGNRKLLLHNGLTEQQLTDSDMYKHLSVEVRDLGNGNVWYNLGCIHLSGMPFYVSLCFRTPCLVCAYLSADRPDFPKSWEEWSEEAELVKKRLHDRILMDMLGRQPDVRRSHPYPYIEYQLAWGTVISSYDPRSAASSIGIHYNLGDSL
ncbi:hypothetical protein [Paenibacillus massiliensis]|uniref:hypothetical protein n=1 Tax=Paenibacillus massiliensis TaxID=225917 RepID=UPI0003FC01AF|nr:hypothetical protein [Paenibacillus massiliensis]